MKIKVQKKNPVGEVTYEYEGVLLSCDEHSVSLEALFDRADRPFQDVVLRNGDRFVEYYYLDRWYNIFEIHDKDNEKIKGWYCNIGRPAVIEEGVVSYVDLALDLWISADGKQTILDEDEFDALDLTMELKTQARRALDEVMALFKTQQPLQ